MRVFLRVSRRAAQLRARPAELPYYESVLCHNSAADYRHAWPALELHALKRRVLAARVELARVHSANLIGVDDGDIRRRMQVRCQRLLCWL